MSKQCPYETLINPLFNKIADICKEHGLECYLATASADDSHIPSVHTLYYGARQFITPPKIECIRRGHQNCELIQNVGS